MASIKLKFRASTVLGREGTLYYQLIHERAIRQIRTKYKVYYSEWDSRSEQLKDSNLGRTEILRSIQEFVKRDMLRLRKIVDSFEEREKPYTVDDVIDLYYSRTTELSFFRFMDEIIDQLKSLGKIRTSETYTVALRSFTAFRMGHDIMLDEMDSDVIMRYEAWLKEKEISMNTTSFYMRILQAVYNRAVEKDLIIQRSPFKHVYTGVEKTIKRAVPFRFIKRIKDLELPAGSTIDFARDMFLFSFYTRGMSFVDMSYLKKKNLQCGTLTYRRRKTGQLLHIRWEKCMQDIVDKYPDMGLDYILPIIKVKEDDRKQYENGLHLVNRKLKEISTMIDLPVNLSMYVARHSWASVARSKNIPVSVISEGMGHDSENTTKIYLASLDNSVIDKANKLVLSGL